MLTLSRPRRALLTCALITVLATTGCGGDDAGDEAAAVPPEATSTVPSGAEDSELDAPVGAVDMLTDFACEPRDGRWQGTATLANTTDAKASFEVTFTVIRTQGNAVVGEKTKTYDLAPGESAAVKVSNIHGGGEDGLECVRRVLKSS